MTTVVDRFLSRELFRYWLVTTLILWLVLVVARFSLYLGQAASGRLPAGTVLQLLALKSVGFFVFLLPLSLFLALLWLFGRLNRDRESLALAASGFGDRQLYRAIALPVTVAVLTVGLLSARLVPQTAQLGYELRTRAEHDLDIRSLTPGRFHSLHNGRWLVYAERAGATPEALKNVFIYSHDAVRPRVLLAQDASIEPAADGGGRYLVLERGHRYDGYPGRGDYRVLTYRRYAIALGDTTPEPERKWDAVSGAELWRSDEPKARAELHMRLSRPLSVLVLVLFAVPLSRFRPAVSRYFPLWLGVLVFTLYFNLLGTGQLWLQQERLPAWLGLWWVHLLMVGLYLLWLAAGRWRAARRAVS
jgi:lipopolysaccharide export system permease protein